MKYEEAITGPDAEEWKKEFDKEHKRMVKHNTWVAVPRSEKLKGGKPLDSTWACKKKSNGTIQASGRCPLQ